MSSFIHWPCPRSNGVLDFVRRLISKNSYQYALICFRQCLEYFFHILEPAEAFLSHDLEKPKPRLIL